MLSNRVPLVLLIDASGSRCGEFPPERLERFIGLPFVKVVRDRKGHVRRMIWQRPEPEPEPWRHLRPSMFAGQRYVKKVQLDSGMKVWELKRILGLTQKPFIAVPASVRADTKGTQSSGFTDTPLPESDQ
jgi:hypothetical protein